MSAHDSPSPHFKTLLEVMVLNVPLAGPPAEGGAGFGHRPPSPPSFRLVRLRKTIAALLIFFPILGGSAIGAMGGLGMAVMTENGLEGLYRLFIQGDLGAIPAKLPFNLYLFLGLMAIVGMAGLKLCLLVWKWGVVKVGLLTPGEWVEFEGAFNKWGIQGVWKKVPKDKKPPE